VSRIDFDDSGWSFAETKVYKEPQVFVANQIINESESSLFAPGKAFAYGVFNDQVRYMYERTRIALDSLEGISLMSEAKIPKNLVNPLPDYAKKDDESVIF
jgi:hypothetical protein